VEIFQVEKANNAFKKGLIKHSQYDHGMVIRNILSKTLLQQYTNVMWLQAFYYITYENAF
jgi:hypothetical protein